MSVESEQYGTSTESRSIEILEGNQADVVGVAGVAFESVCEPAGRNLQVTVRVFGLQCFICPAATGFGNGADGVAMVDVNVEIDRFGRPFDFAGQQLAVVEFGGDVDLDASTIATSALPARPFGRGRKTPVVVMASNLIINVCFSIRMACDTFTVH